MYGKLVDGKLIYAPISINVGDKCIINPTDTEYIAAGYKTIITSDMPVKKGYHYTSSFTEDNNNITQVWTEIADTDAEKEAEYKAAEENAIRTQYTYSEEIAILRDALAKLSTAANFVTYNNNIAIAQTTAYVDTYTYDNTLWYKSPTWNGTMSIKAGDYVHVGDKTYIALVDLTDIEANYPSTELIDRVWSEPTYKEGYRVIPETMITATMFHINQIGWWNDKLYKSKIDNNSWTPTTYPDGWEEYVSA